MMPAALSLWLLASAAPAVLAQEAAVCTAGDPAGGLTEVAGALQTLAAPQHFDIGLATAVRARDLRAQGELQATCYDDGEACPGGCDEHVVASNATNGSARFHAPGSTAGDWQDCRNGQDCEVCFGADPADCITVTYRGTGPDAGRADFTAAFWEELCAVEGLPEALDSECDRIEGSSEGLGAVSCLEQPDAPGCEGRVPSQVEREAARQAVADCLAQRDDSWRCYYQGRNDTLSAGACENGAVNSSGWDCCTGDRFHDACVTGCDAYYVAVAVVAPLPGEPAEGEPVSSEVEPAQPAAVAEERSAPVEPVLDPQRPPLAPRWRPFRRPPGPRR